MYVVIPARYASSRLPGKPLADVAGKTLIERVYDCARASGAAHIVIATDDERVAAAAQRFGARVCMTGAQHACGTERIAEVIGRLRIAPQEIIVNLQGDEPLMPGSLIRQVADTLLAHGEAVMATACHAIQTHEEFISPNVVKVVTDQRGYALYFSRAPIPWPREAQPGAGRAPRRAFRHIGLYAYRAAFVGRYAAWPACPLEEVEQLEQLRVLWHGERIAVCESAELPAAGVDTPEDLERVRRYFQARQARDAGDGNLEV